MNKVEKPTKILTMGIGAYFLTFLMCWVLFITPLLSLPTATYTVDNRNPAVGETVTFDGSGSFDSDGEIVKYVWDFGDDTESQEEVPTVTHSYSKAGEYIVELKVVDEHGISRSYETTINVVAPS